MVADLRRGGRTVAPDLRAEIDALDDLRVAELRERYAELTGEAAHSRNKQHLRRRCAWLIQAREYGGLSELARQRAHELARLSDARLTPPKAAARKIEAPRDPRLPAVGATIARRYKGVDIVVEVLRDGFEYDGVRFRSLSAVAKAISGTHTNGFVWFGLAEKPR
jgi:hypothetical protein